MDNLIWLAIILGVSAVLVRSLFGREKTWKTKRDYEYTPKDSLMTQREMNFFWKLQEVVKDKYYIFPQVHLSALLDHRVPGQDWKYAFFHINGKSVDYVLCSKVTLQPLYAIELDDTSHDRAERISRDIEVERIFDEANVPLVRFRDYKVLSSLEIAQTLAEARRLSNEKNTHED